MTPAEYPSGGTVRLTIDDAEITARPGQSVAAALLEAGIRSWRSTRARNRPRGLFCGIGVCYDCLLSVDGIANQRACLVPVRDGMRLITGTSPLPESGTRDDDNHVTAARATAARATAAFDAAFDVAVVGAGPAGLAAAVTAAEHGRRIVVVDAATQIGGQYWRHPNENHPHGDESSGHRDWDQFTSLRERFERYRRAGHISYLSSTQVWFVGAPGPAATGTRRTLYLAPATAAVPSATAADAPGDRAPSHVTADTLVLCPGGYDRQLPIPGWDLPGVMAAGGVQALLKGHRTLSGRTALVAGTGPFLLPVAVQLANAGATVVGVCEANRVSGWARHPGAVAGVPGKIVEGARYAGQLARHRVPVRTSTAVTRIVPDATGDQVGSVEITRFDRDGAPRGPVTTIAVDLVALGWGFTPSLELCTAVGADTLVDVDQSLVVSVDDDQRTSVAGVLAAGEATGVGGALLAVAEGELAGLTAVGSGDTRRAARLRRRIRRYRAFAAAMHATHRVPPRWSEWLTDDTTICRCEEVDHSAVRAARDELGATDARTVKILARPGMGWCQGRVCGFATAMLAAGERPLATEDLHSTARQPLCAPITLAHLAGQQEV